MKLTRRDLIGGVGALTLAGAAGSLVSGSANAKQGELNVGDDGLYHQDWFVESFLDLRDDLKEAL